MIKDILSTLTAEEMNGLNWTLKDSDNTDLLTVQGSQVVYCLLKSYSTFNFVHIANKTDFLTDYASFKAINQHNYNKIAQALYTEYNPIENYDRYEDSYTDTNTTTPAGSTIMTSESDAYDTSTTKNTVTTTTSYGAGTNTQTSSYSDEKHIHGNIGVAETSQIIKHEIEMRVSNSLANIIAKEYGRTEIY